MSTAVFLLPYYFYFEHKFHTHTHTKSCLNGRFYCHVKRTREVQRNDLDNDDDTGDDDDEVNAVHDPTLDAVITRRPSVSHLTHGPTGAVTVNQLRRGPVRLVREMVSVLQELFVLFFVLQLAAG